MNKIDKFNLFSVMSFGGGGESSSSSAGDNNNSNGVVVKHCTYSYVNGIWIEYCTYSRKISDGSLAGGSGSYLENN